MNPRKSHCSILLFLVLILLVNCCRIVVHGQNNSSVSNSLKILYHPEKDLDDLFTAVQLAGIYTDSKTFPDCDPVLAPDSILTLYYKKKKDPDFDLRSFIGIYFTCPVSENRIENISPAGDIVDHLNSHWNYLTRIDSGAHNTISTRIPLRFPYVVPGGRFREIYYWDSYFTMEGLAASGRMDLVGSMLDNFALLINEFGHMPNGNRSYFLSRSQPPFFAEMVKLFMREKNDSAGLKYLPALIKEYKFWMNSNGETIYRRTVKVGNVTLNRYWDDHPVPRPEAFKEDYLLAGDLSAKQQEDFYRNIRAACESGWDFSSRWLKDEKNFRTIQTTSILPIDLNCLMYNMEAVISRIYHIKSFDDSAAYYADIAEKRKCMIREIFWDQEAGYFFDYNYSDKKRTGTYTLAGVYPLYFGVSTDDQAKLTTEVLHRKFLHYGGLATTIDESGEQWDAPNGWPPLQWIAIGGLENYGYDGFADELAQRWLNLNKRVYQQTGKMMEKYNVVNPDLPGGGGEYPLQDGFGWTNGVYLGLLRKGYSPGE